jgi:transcription elongation factor GreB
MSRGFVKESDQEEPIVIPPRASLPEGQTNYVTHVGKDLLEQEKKDLEHQRATLSITDDTERRREITKIDGQLQLLQERLNTAQVIDLKEQPQHEVRFGAQVKFKLNGTLQNFQLVGVDEANVKAKKIAFTSPLARALTSRTQGEQFNFELGTEQRPIEILDINYTV